MQNVLLCSGSSCTPCKVMHCCYLCFRSCRYRILELPISRDRTTNNSPWWPPAATAIWKQVRRVMWGLLWFLKWHRTKYGDPYMEFVLCVNPFKVHTHTHTAIYAAALCWGFGSLLKGTSVVVLKVERALYIHSPHLQFPPARDSNSQPLDYKSNSLTIRLRLSDYYENMIRHNVVVVFLLFKLSRFMYFIFRYLYIYILFSNPTSTSAV